MPAGYTGNFFFEFQNGGVVARHLANTSDDDAWSFVMCNNPAVVRKSILKDIFGSDKKEDLVLNIYIYNVRLERHKGLSLSEKKADSLSQKYFSIPPENRNYYSAPKEDLSEMKETLIFNDELTVVEGEFEFEQAPQGCKSKQSTSQTTKTAEGQEATRET